MKPNDTRWKTTSPRKNRTASLRNPDPNSATYRKTKADALDRLPGLANTSGGNFPDKDTEHYFHVFVEGYGNAYGQYAETLDDHGDLLDKVIKKFKYPFNTNYFGGDTVKPLHEDMMAKLIAARQAMDAVEQACVDAAHACDEISNDAMD